LSTDKDEKNETRTSVDCDFSVGAGRSTRHLGRPQRKGSSTLSGVVLGPDDRPVAHASVSYQSSSGSAPHVVRTDAHGQFSISKLKADNYDLRASGKGVFSTWEKNVTLRSGETKNLTLR